MIRKETPLPLLIQVEKGKSWAALMSHKAFNKSLEQGILWVNVPGGNRILPLVGEIPFLSLEKAQGYFYALMPQDTPQPKNDNTLDDIDLEDHSEVSTQAEIRGSGVLESLEQTIAKRKKEMPEGSYTTHLFSKGMEKIKKKAGEEAIELLLAQGSEDLIYESADLIYHLMVLWQAGDVSLSQVLAELKRRDG